MGVEQGWVTLTVIGDKDGIGWDNLMEANVALSRDPGQIRSEHCVEPRPRSKPVSPISSALGASGVSDMYNAIM